MNNPGVLLSPVLGEGRERTKAAHRTERINMNRETETLLPQSLAGPGELACEDGWTGNVDFGGRMARITHQYERKQH